jgi:hypothetical protein
MELQKLTIFKRTLVQSECNLYPYNGEHLAPEGGVTPVLFIEMAIIVMIQIVRPLFEPG